MTTPNEPVTPPPGEAPPPPAPQQPYSAPQGYAPQAGQPYGQYQYGTQPVAPPAPRPPSGFGALFDTGFRSYATPLVAKFLYVIVLIAAILTVVSGVISGIFMMIKGAELGNLLSMASSFGSGSGDGGMTAFSILGGLLTIVMSALAALVMLGTYRLILEFFVTQFSAAGYIRKMATKPEE